MREKESKRGNKSDEVATTWGGDEESLSLLPPVEGNSIGGGGPVEISEGGSCNNKEDKGMGTERYLRPLAGAKGCQTERIASRCTEGHLLWFNTESHNLKEEELKETWLS